MKKNYSGWEDFVYLMACVVTFGAVWIFRVIISEAIRRAIKDSE